MTALASWGVVAGAALGLGLWSLLALVPRFSRPRLVDRVAPYVVDVSQAARDLVRRRPTDPLPVLGLALAPVVERGTRLLEAVVGGSTLIRHRLRQSGSPLGLEAYRAQQLAWAAGGAIAGVLVALVLARQQPLPAPLPLVVVLVFAALGLLGRDQVLARRAKARRERMSAELPTLLEFLTLSLSAGEGILDALRRVSRVSTGEIALELRQVVAQVHSGVPLAEALRELSTELQLPSFSRAVEQLLAAMDRGTPLAEVLRAHAQDARDESKRELLEVAGRKEVAMLVPLVFLILPVTVLFAVFPGLVVLQLGF